MDKCKTLDDQEYWHQALDRIAYSDKQNYLQAYQLVPELVSLESNPSWYLVSCNYDYNAASAKLTKYWKVRCELFGERAFLPMKYGQALGDEEMAFLSLRSMCLVPCDNQGRAVLMSDSSKNTEYWNVHLQPRLRAGFALYSIAMQNKESHTRGICYFVLFGLRGKTYMFSNTTASKLSEWSETVFSIRSVHLFLISIEKRLLPRFALRIVLDPLILEYCFNHMHSTTVLVCSSLEEVTEGILNTKKFSKANLPTYLGGEWIDEHDVHNQFTTTTSQDDQMNNTTTLVNNNVAYVSYPKLKVTYLQRYPEVYQMVQLLPQVDTAALFEVEKCVPYLIQNESDPAMYMNCAKDAKSAAESLAAYWKLRYKIFHLSALKLLLSPTSVVLDGTDIEYMKAGYIRQLPKNELGHPVLFYAMRQLSENFESINKKCLFYMLQWMTNSLIAGNNKAVMILHDFTIADIPIFNLIVDYVSVFPLDVKYLILCKSTAITFSKTCFKSVQESAEVIFCPLDSDFCRALVERGFLARYLPTVIGGSYQDSMASQSFTNEGTTNNASKKQSQLVSSETFLQKEQSRLKSRRNRERKKMRFETLQAKAKVLTNWNIQLRNQNQNLERLLNDAHNCVYDAARNTGNMAVAAQRNNTVWVQNTLFDSHNSTPFGTTNTYTPKVPVKSILNTASYGSQLAHTGNRFHSIQNDTHNYSNGTSFMANRKAKAKTNERTKISDYIRNSSLQSMVAADSRKPSSSLPDNKDEELKPTSQRPLPLALDVNEVDYFVGIANNLDQP